ncbi:MAG: hypothetical protein V3U24_08430 [Candidatus Neomarinimicrobiota bacterium]
MQKFLIWSIVIAAVGCSSPAPNIQPETASTAQTELAAEVINKDLHIVGHPFAIKSEHHKNGFYVAAKVAGPGIEDGVVCLWLMSGAKDHPGLIINANGAAKNFSPGLPWGPKTKAEASITDREARLLVRWVEVNVN